MVYHLKSLRNQMFLVIRIMLPLYDPVSTAPQDSMEHGGREGKGCGSSNWGLSCSNLSGEQKPGWESEVGEL